MHFRMTAQIHPDWVICRACVYFLARSLSLTFPRSVVLMCGVLVLLVVGGERGRVAMTKKLLVRTEDVLLVDDKTAALRKSCIVSKPGGVGIPPRHEGLRGGVLQVRRILGSKVGSGF